MKNSPLKLTGLVVALSLTVTGCSSIDQDDKHAAAKTGAVGGALLGLTLGALTGDAGLAAKGAVAGGVAGGVAGATVDLEENRNNKRSSSRDDAIANVGNQNGSNADSKADSWEELNNFMGDWDVAISGSYADKPAKATANASGQLVKTTKAQVTINQVELDGEAVDISLTTKFSYNPTDGYSAVIHNEQNNQEVHFSGEYQPALNRYNFYPTNSDALFDNSVAGQDFHLQLGFAGSKVWFLDTYAIVDGQETKIQSYRFNKKS
ncbi:MAG: hypothetical protein QNK26_03350 [Moritella sp.]|uniref:hypothetical protein n=1 Tax=Moritella sp. TaxID=78556 RepID=UPI0029B710EB|nr:hypothetical protein [Moritella sp.]MDX2319616.1 hypothetical protein [Moritella sp.]